MASSLASPSFSFYDINTTLTPSQLPLLQGHSLPRVPPPLTRVDPYLPLHRSPLGVDLYHVSLSSGLRVFLSLLYVRI